MKIIFLTFIVLILVQEFVCNEEIRRRAGRQKAILPPTTPEVTTVANKKPNSDELCQMLGGSCQIACEGLYNIFSTCSLGLSCCIIFKLQNGGDVGTEYRDTFLIETIRGEDSNFDKKKCRASDYDCDSEEDDKPEKEHKQHPVSEEKKISAEVPVEIPESTKSFEEPEKVYSDSVETMEIEDSSESSEISESDEEDYVPVSKEKSKKSRKLKSRKTSSDKVHREKLKPVKVSATNRHKKQKKVSSSAEKERSPVSSSESRVSFSGSDEDIEKIFFSDKPYVPYENRKPKKSKTIKRRKISKRKHSNTS
ncbi:CLUMA_CG000489, isoform A [Clunio marinus]|uniref:CLUMA_CG000489, isoform A n=1 Tax=Clunio marinus TaxID=568069 RepID=A0A1J1HF69_9DIPT|nr:CLUMA_CG000489, isoform A [Clunio marinus]